MKTKLIGAFRDVRERTEKLKRDFLEKRFPPCPGEKGNRNTYWVGSNRKINSIPLGLLGSFAELRKATISFAMFVRPSVHMEQLGSHWTDFHDLSCWSIFRRSVEKFQTSLKSDKNNGHFYMKSYARFSYLALFFLEWEMFQTKFLISNVRRVLNVLCFLLSNSAASEFYMPTFRNTLFNLRRQVGVKND